MKLFKDMLTEFNTKTKETQYSQGRVYLLWSVVAYYITLGILLVAGMHKGDDPCSFRRCCLWCRQTWSLMVDVI